MSRPDRPDRRAPESVWDYPRPPRLEQSDRHVVIRRGHLVIADTRASFRVLETSHPPSWYLDPSCVLAGALRVSAAPATVCEWKGRATYWDIIVGGSTPLIGAAWSYPAPTAGFEPIADWLAFRADQLLCEVDGERVTAQAGGFYGGWITADVVGPFKGAPGTAAW